MDVASLIFGLMGSNSSDVMALEGVVGFGKLTQLAGPLGKISSSYATGGIAAVLENNPKDIQEVVTDLGPNIGKVAPNLANLAEALVKQQPSIAIPPEIISVLRNAGGDLQAVILAAAPLLSKFGGNIASIAKAAQPPVHHATS